MADTGWSQAGFLASGSRGPLNIKQAFASRRAFPSSLRTRRVASCGGRHRSQRRVRGRLSRPSLFVPKCPGHLQQNQGTRVGHHCQGLRNRSPVFSHIESWHASNNFRQNTSRSSVERQPAACTCPPPPNRRAIRATSTATPVVPFICDGWLRRLART